MLDEVNGLKLVSKQIAKIDVGFTFTSMHVVLKARGQTHTDPRNVGRSMGIPVGPLTGGALCTYDKECQQTLILESGKWNSVDGYSLHFVLPFCGQRLAIIAVTHSIALSSEAGMYSDTLIKQVFRPPVEFGRSVAVPATEVVSLDLLHKSARVYENDCDDIHASSHQQHNPRRQAMPLSSSKKSRMRQLL